MTICIYKKKILKTNFYNNKKKMLRTNFKKKYKIIKNKIKSYIDYYKSR